MALHRERRDGAGIGGEYEAAVPTRPPPAVERADGKSPVIPQGRKITAVVTHRSTIIRPAYRVGLQAGGQNIAGPFPAGFQLGALAGRIIEGPKQARLVRERGAQ